MKKALHWIFYGNIFIAICAVCMTIETYLVLGIPLNFQSAFPLLLIVFFSTFFIYNIDLITHREGSKEEIVSGRLKWRNRQRPILNVINICVGILILALSFFSSFKAFLFFLHLAVISLAYYFSFEIGPAKIISLRRIPFLKAFVITYVWAGSSVFLPVLRNEISLGSPEVIELFIERYLFLFALAIIFDIRDLNFDFKDIRTIPGMFGSGKTKMLSCILLVIAGVFVCLHYSNLYLVSAFVLSYIAASFLIYKAKPDSGEYYFLLLMDGAMVLQSALVMLSVYKVI